MNSLSYYTITETMRNCKPQLIFSKICYYVKIRMLFIKDLNPSTSCIFMQNWWIICWPSIFFPSFIVILLLLLGIPPSVSKRIILDVECKLIFNYIKQNQSSLFESSLTQTRTNLIINVVVIIQSISTNGKACLKLDFIHDDNPQRM